jgi:sialic acid synthase SpsE/quercetin dioxygenase-like cupin family protein
VTPAFASKPLVVLEMANNHMGSLTHGMRILDAFAEVAEPFRETFAFGFKLQYRDLDTFIHPNFQARMDIKYIKRFQETRLSQGDFLALREGMSARGFLAICTPFDEASVDLIETHRYDRLKIASCSMGDWPLLERLARSPLPVIASTAGASLELLDRIVSFFEHRERSLTLLHCVGEYPTPAERLQMNQIDLLRNRYPGHEVGWSTHEDPDTLQNIPLAVAKGARVFEKHVGLPTDQYALNAYSASPQQMRRWLEAAQEALVACGAGDGRHASAKEELDSLRSLQRGVFVKAPVAKGEKLDPSTFLLAMPTEPGQLTANDLGKYLEFRALEDLPAMDPVFLHQVQTTDHRLRINDIVARVRGLLDEARTVVSTQATVEISHHYGLDQFETYGATILNVVNRAYCKKLIVLLPGQRHPEQFHKLKEETFHVLHGSMQVSLDGEVRTCRPGDVLTVEREVRHTFWSDQGCVIEEISSTHYKDDSYYLDPAIGANPDRKTYVTHFFG